MRRRALLPLAASLAAALVTSAFQCGGGAPPAATPASAPTPVPITNGPRVVFPSGAVVAVEVASTPDAQERGLMFRESMPPNAGMVFVFEGLEIRPFWMKNCHFPLDMIYTTKDGTIVDVLRGVPPCPADPCPSYPPKAKADTVVEVNAGVADRSGAKVGATLKYVEIPGR